jgi:hypothetical protein
MKKPIERSLADKKNEIVRAWVKPFEDGLTENRRKLTPEQHAEMFPNHPLPAPLEIDEAAADPIHDHRPQSRPKGKVNRLLSILDDLEKPNRRFNT